MTEIGESEEEATGEKLSGEVGGGGGGGEGVGRGGGEGGKGEGKTGEQSTVSMQGGASDRL